MSKVQKIVFANLRKKMPDNVQETDRTPNRLDLKGNSPHPVVNTRNVQNRDIESGKRERSRHTKQHHQNVN